MEYLFSRDLWSTYDVPSPGQTALNKTSLSAGGLGLLKQADAKRGQAWVKFMVL